MSAFIYGIVLQWKMNVRNKEILIFYYVVPLVFYLFMGGIFTSVIPDFNQTLIQAMIVFGVTMGGVLGSPYPLVEVFGSEVKKAYQVGKIPFWTIAAGNFISGILHLFLMSLVILFTAPIFFDAARPENLGAFLLGLLLLIMASLSVGMVFGLFIRSAAKMGVATQVVFLPSIMMSGIMFPISMLPKILQTAGKVLPATWGYQSMCTKTLDIGLLYPMGIIILICFCLSAWKLKRLHVD